MNTALLPRIRPAWPTDRLDIWRGDTLGMANAATLPTGYGALDAQLPGGGWPATGLVELLQAHTALHEWRLLLPGLCALTGAHSGPVVLIGSPAGLVPFAPSLAAQGLPADRLLWVPAAADAARLWACEQSLRCADVVAVLAWLPKARADALRRLHMIALENAKPLFVLRPEAAQHQSSAAPLRLLLDGTQTMRVHILKRRGPPLTDPLQLPAYAPRMAALLQGRPPGLRQPQPTEVRDALDRAVAA